MNHNPFRSYLKKAFLFVPVLVLVLGLTFTPGDNPALADPPEPYMVMDINTTTYGDGISALVNVNGTLFFGGNDGVHGDELWNSDGTEVGTVLVKDIHPGGEGSGPYDDDYWSPIGVNGTLFINADDGVHGKELWKSDGTESGTVLVKDIFPGGDDASPSYLTNVNGTLFFQADDGVHGPELWKSDGTEAGTVLVKDIYPGSGGSYPGDEWQITSMNGMLFFCASGGGGGLWKSDGTEAGTVLVKNVCGMMTDVDGTLFFSGNDGLLLHGRELWKSDGSESGTVLVKDINPGGQGGIDWGASGIAVDGTFLFTANDGVHGKELWKSDGTETGTVMVKDIHTGCCSDIEELTNINGVLFFRADDGVNGKELWKSDGTEAGTFIVKDIYPGSDNSYPGELTNVNGMLYFTAWDGVHVRGLWKSDGTETGTQMVKDNDPEELTNVDGTLFFQDQDIYGGLWKSDGTEAGTVLVKDIYPGSKSSGPGGLTGVDGMIFFKADDGLHGEELWKSDGTEGGTELVKDIYSGNSESNIQEMTDINGTLFFAANDGVNSMWGGELWKSDGSEAGTILVKDLRSGDEGSNPQDLTDVNGTLFFTADDGVHGRELWKSDGTEAGTQMVKDIYSVGGSYPDYLTNVDGTLFFRANDGVHDWELWKSDGSEPGTLLVKDINTGGPSSPGELTDVNGTIFFCATGGLWKSDGSESGTVLVKNVCGSELTDVNGTLFFVHNYGIWKSDGTEAGIVLAKAMEDDYWIRELTDVNGILFFIYDDTALWKSDGSETGTMLIKGIGLIYHLFNVYGTAFFHADDDDHGCELWKSDGTEAGTLLVKDIKPGTEYPCLFDYDPKEFETVNGKFFFNANDGVHGRELWALDVPQTNRPPSIVGTQSGQHVNDNATIDPFTGVTISDPDDDTLTVIVSLNNANKGDLTNLGGFVESPSGTYTFVGSPTSATTAIRALTFDPTENRKTPGSTDTTIFTISADDGTVDPVTDDTTTVIATSINDLPTITGTVAGQTVDDNANIAPFTGVTIADPDKNAQLTVTVSLDDPDKGVLTNLGGFVEGPAGTYTFECSPSEATTAIQGLIFYPTAGRAPVGQTETTSFTISADDSFAAPVTDDTTTVIVTAVEDPNTPPSISGTVAGQTMDDNATIDPFTTVTISDPDTVAITVTVSLDDPAKGNLVNLGGFVEGPPGTFTFTGSPAEATTAIRALTFDPTEDRVPVGQDETTTLTISADDGIAEPVTDDTTTVIVTAVEESNKHFLPLILR